MKNLHRIIVLCCFCLFTCQTDNEPQQEELQELEIQSPSAKANSEASRNQKDNLEEKMQWAAYAAAKVYLHDKSARNEMLEHMSEDNTIPFVKLMGERSFSSPFYAAFVRELTEYANITDKTDDEDEEEEEDEPKGDVNACCMPPPDEPDPTRDRVKRFLDYLIDDNCVEFYFPNLDLFDHNNKIVSITSTAHPLTNAEENVGYWRFPQLHTFPNGETLLANEIIVDNEFVENEGLVLVVRPIRMESSRKCEYAQYEVADFQEFLKID